MRRCKWFAGCTHTAVHIVDHPILDGVPTCDRCVKKLNLTPKELPK